MSFTDSDWDYAGRAPAPRPKYVWLWSLAAGTVIGVAIATLVFYSADLLRTRATIDSALARPAAPAASASAPSLAQAARDGAAAPSNPPLASAAPVPAAPLTLAEPLMPQAPAAGPAPRPSAAEARRKELAWARFYHRPAYCDGNPSADQLIDCANHYIRSKREFDARFAAGQL